VARPFAAFDIDGTLIRWQLYHAIGDRLAKQGIIEGAEFDRVRRTRMNWKRRSGEDSFNDYELALVKVFDQALKGLQVSIFKEVVGAVFDEYKEQVYTYTRDLIESLKKQDYLLFAVSGSPEMIVSLLAQFYGFDDYAGTAYELKAGCFTGKKSLAVGHKDDLLKELVIKHDSTYQASLAVGDSEGDIKMLALTDQPIAFNPTNALMKHAKQAGWPIVLERKNVVYNLEPANGDYKLQS
jgi:HAD superfamily hydrolase (TIGR01490 family)